MLISFNEANGAIIEMFAASPNVETSLYDDFVGRVPAGGRVAMMDAPVMQIARMFVSDFTPDPVVDHAAVVATLSERPAAAHGWPATGAAPMTLGMGALPAGTAVTATNEAGESVTTDDAADPIILSDSESYSVTINPPWPYMPETLTIEVT